MAALYEKENRNPESPSEGERGFEDVIREHQRMIHSLCYRMTGSLDDADDLAQETFIQAYQNLGSFRGDSKLSSWLYRIAMNRCLNWRSSRDRKARLHEQWTEMEQPAPDENHGLNEQVRDALLALSPEQRAAIVLTVYDGMTHGQAAQILGCSETTISWRIFMGRAKLKRILNRATTREAHDE